MEGKVYRTVRHSLLVMVGRGAEQYQYHQYFSVLTVYVPTLSVGCTLIGIHIIRIHISLWQQACRLQDSSHSTLTVHAHLWNCPF